MDTLKKQHNEHSIQRLSRKQPPRKDNEKKNNILAVLHIINTSHYYQLKIPFKDIHRLKNLQIC